MKSERATERKRKGIEGEKTIKIEKKGRKNERRVREREEDRYNDGERWVDKKRRRE